MGHGASPNRDGDRDELSGPLGRLADWEDAGAGWRVAEHTGDHAVVMLLTCTGEAVDRLETGDPEALDYLRRRRSSEDDA